MSEKFQVRFGKNIFYFSLSKVDWNYDSILFNGMGNNDVIVKFEFKDFKFYKNR
jgi:hypothetical protein